MIDNQVYNTRIMKKGNKLFIQLPIRIDEEAGVITKFYISRGSTLVDDGDEIMWDGTLEEFKKIINKIGDEEWDFLKSDEWFE
ncbi:MAG: hypothetical protein ACTSU2_08515 [Promethearchaeota archaeon]